MAERIRQHIIFHGRVQGVGFRYRAMYAAQAAGLGGWVKNRYDGTVEMEVEGDRFSIGRMLEQLQTGTFIQIDNMEIDEIPICNEAGFRVKY